MAAGTYTQWPLIFVPLVCIAIIAAALEVIVVCINIAFG